MSDLILSNIASGYNLGKINNNFQAIQDKINDEILHLTGGNNIMQQGLDMNSNRLYNLPIPSSNREPLVYEQLAELANNDIGNATNIVYTDADGNVQQLDKALNNLKGLFGVCKSVASMTGATITLVNGQTIAPTHAASIANTGMLIKTSEYNSGSGVGGAEYLLKTLAQHRVDINDPSWVPDGMLHHYVCGGTTYVAICQFQFATPPLFGAVADGVTDDTAAIQAMLDYVSNNSVYAEGLKADFEGRTYLVSKPLLFYGDNIILEGSGCTIRKNTDDLPSYTIPIRNNGTGDIDPNVNSIFVSSNRVRWLYIANMNLEGVNGARPTGVWFFGYENYLENLFIRNVDVGVHCPSSWVTTVRHVVVRLSVRHGIWWDRARVSGTGQSGTSVHFDNCAVFSPGGKGFYLQDCDYSSFTTCACDHATEEAYWFQGCSALSGQVAWEARNPISTSPAVRFASGSSGSLVIDSYDPNASLPAAAIASTESKVTLNGRLRVSSAFFDVSLGSIIDATGLAIDPYSGDELDPSRFTASDSSHIYYTPRTAGAFDQRVRYDICSMGMLVELDGVEYVPTSTSGDRDIFYGTNKLMVVYDVEDFHTTFSNQIKVPLSDIYSVIPGFDDNGWRNRPLAIKIGERNNIGVGHYVQIASGAIATSGVRDYVALGDGTKVALDSVTPYQIIADELVITLDPAGGNRHRITCEITPLL